MTSPPDAPEPSRPTWDPEQYALYADHRSRPFFDLVSRVSATSPQRIIDLGCGSGELTETLLRRWPDAEVRGVDNSADMLAKAAAHAVEGRLNFGEADLATFQPGPAYDVVVSNAAYQWVEGHPEILARIAADLPPGGWLAIQVPGNFRSPSHNEIRRLVAEDPWQEAMSGLVLREDAVLEASEYGGLMAAAGLQVDTWQTTYNQVLLGADPVLEWVKGTALRPVLSHLRATRPELESKFLEELARRLANAYENTTSGTIFPFRRIFAVGHRVINR